MGQVTYERDRGLSADAFVDVLRRSGLDARRPIDDRACVEAMVAHADLMITAWDGDRLVGVARSVTDFAYCCYLSDLAVDEAYQGQGIGRQLQALTRAQLGPRCSLILLAAPAAQDYYPRLGFSRHDSCWLLRPGKAIAGGTGSNSEPPGGP